MSKLKTVFACQACGFESSKWLGRCPDCGEWNSFVEERQEQASPGGVIGHAGCMRPTAPGSPASGRATRWSAQGFFSMACTRGRTVRPSRWNR